MLPRVVRSVLRSAGLDIVRHRPAVEYPPDLSGPDVAIMRRVRPFTMTSVERLAAMIGAARYVARAGLPGALVECGVWRGGSMMAAALACLEEGDRERELALFDTFEGMAPPSARDVSVRGESAATLYHDRGGNGVSVEWCAATQQEVEANLASTGYPTVRIRLVRGRVEDTLPGQAPERIALLRLDTDWYESTRHELHHLFPRVVPGGVIIIDDYGYWAGCRQATDEYLAGLTTPVLLHRIDDTGRLVVKR